MFVSSRHCLLCNAYNECHGNINIFRELKCPCTQVYASTQSLVHIQHFLQLNITVCISLHLLPKMNLSYSDCSERPVFLWRSYKLFVCLFLFCLKSTWSSSVFVPACCGLTVQWISAGMPAKPFACRNAVSGIRNLFLLPVGCCSVTESEQPRRTVISFAQSALANKNNFSHHGLEVRHTTFILGERVQSLK